MKKIFFLLLLVFFMNVQAQIHPNTFFLIVDNQSSNYSKKDHLREYVLKSQKKHYWGVALMHFTNEVLGNPPRYALLLPMSRLLDFQRRGRVIEVKKEEEKWLKMSFEEFSKEFLSLISEYNYSWSKDDTEFISCRYNVFIIEQSDWEKDYIPCYEAYITIQERNE